MDPYTSLWSSDLSDKRQTDRQTETERAGLSVCVCVCVRERERVCGWVGKKENSFWLDQPHCVNTVGNEAFLVDPQL